MTDSFTGRNPLNKTTTLSDIYEWNLPFKIGLHGNQDNFHQGFNSGSTQRTQPSKEVARYHEWMTIEAPFGAYKARGFWADGDYSRLGGYEFSVNSSVFIGHNVLLDKSVPRLAELLYEHFRLMLLRRVTHPRAIEALQLEAMRLTSVTITDCYATDTKEDAQKARRGWQALTELENEKQRGYPAKAKEIKPAFTIGPAESGTSYLKGREKDHAGYVKDRVFSSSDTFDSVAIQDAIYSEGEKAFRHESTWKGVALQRLELTTLEQWRRYGATKAYDKIQRENEKQFGLLAPLRSRRPKPEQIEALAEPDRSMVLMHLDGHDSRLHAAVLAYDTELESQKFFSAVKRRVLAKLRIDLSIRWKVQSWAASSDIYEVLSKDPLYVPPELAPHCFTSESTAELLRQYRLEIARSVNKMVIDRGITDWPVNRLAAIDVGPLNFDPRLLNMERLEVDPAVFDALGKVNRPLYPILEAHGIGYFGDISLADVEANWVAMENHEPVKSVYSAGRNQIVVTTEYSLDEAGIWAPFVRVTAQREKLH